MKFRIVKILVKAAVLLAVLCVLPLAGLRFLGGGKTDAGNVIVMRDVAYGLHPRQRLDVYLPPDAAARKPLGIFLWIHGGAWSGGDKSIYAVQAKDSALWGYAGISVNYRLNSEDRDRPNTHPAQVEDVARAMDFLAANAAFWNIDAERAIVAGHSAGGHLALLYAYGYDRAKRVKAALAFAAPTDFTAPEWKGVVNPPMAETVLPRLLGCAAGDDPGGVWRAASPLFRAGEHPVPTVLVHGKLDATVPVEQARRLDAELERLGAPHLLLVEENGTHDLKTFDSAAVAQFLLRHAEP